MGGTSPAPAPVLRAEGGNWNGSWNGTLGMVPAMALGEEEVPKAPAGTEGKPQVGSAQLWDRDGIQAQFLCGVGVG